MKKRIVYLLISVCILSVMGICAACNPTTDETEPKTYTVEFAAQSGGKVEGNLSQTVREGESTQKVTAIADDGYYFAGWADAEINSDETITQNERIVDSVNGDRYCYATFERKTFQVKFIAGENGRIEGELVQSGKFEDETSNVTAIPNVGYQFVGWSDGVTEPTRKAQFTKNKEITANFKVITNVYTYNYKFADSGCDAQSISLTYGQLENTVFAVPKRMHSTFGGWYADRYLTQQVSDENGNIVNGDELFLSESTQLYAKWISQNTHKYKILIVYVTSLNAELTTRDGNGKIQVDYNMTDVERQICQMITEKISFELNDLAVADFQVDEYFTTVPLTRENIQEKYRDNSAVDHKVYAYDIPEVRGLLDEYDSVLTSFSMNDYVGELRYSGGEANSKYGSINFDGKLGQLIDHYEPIENLLDPYNIGWGEFLRTYLHEFAHTIELCVNGLFNYHNVVGEYIWDSVSDPLISEKLYFLNKAEVDGNTVGVPYEYWEGKVAEVYYEAMEGGTVHSVDGLFIYVYGHVGHTQYVMYGEDARGVYARPSKGYEFVGWSDGVETATRQDTNVTEDLHIYAIFKLKE